MGDSMTDSIVPFEGEAAFKLVGLYLLDKKWFRDGDDTGIWRDGTKPFDSPGYSMSEAFAIQQERDGVNQQGEIDQ